ncbi:MAG: bifunctional precorrin-2 dehydrogenase/sirohydrochlorin ferrochelatase [Acidobacteria bacterium]|nr:bifunctional precorrin-2 dehydrogenase/sirohydrochlorin ferrochelatase [Acidobacteriota bacterium]
MCCYPVFLDLRNRPVLVVGAGKVALRKVNGLLEAGARITLISPEGEREFEKLPVQWRRRRFRASDVGRHALVFTATNDRAVNHAVAQVAARRRIPVNVADSAEECTFLTPARVRQGRIQVAVSAGGSPRQAVAVRNQIARWLSDAKEAR